MKKLIKGEYGLAKTFWLFWAAPIFLFSLIFDPLSYVQFFIWLNQTSYTLAYILALAVPSVLFLYNVVMAISTWNAANKYTGKKLWPVATKIYVSGFVLLAIYTTFFSYTDEPPTNETSDTSDNIQTILNGTWGMDIDDEEYNCAGNPHMFTFSDNEESFSINFIKPIINHANLKSKISHYEILSLSDYTITASVKNETQKDDKGNLIVWSLIMISPDMYVWHRSDWVEERVTAAIVRCQQPNKSVKQTV